VNIVKIKPGLPKAHTFFFVLVQEKTQEKTFSKRTPLAQCPLTAR
jgi:hypothetical protein